MNWRVGERAIAAATAANLTGQIAAPVRSGLAFEVASVKANRTDASATSLFALGPGDAYTPGDRFSASNQPLIAYLRFAFKLGQGDLVDLAPWIYSERFDIEARAPRPVTKDDMRSMMQSLLIDRFRLRTHTAPQSRPVFDLRLTRREKTGPQLRRHLSSGSCEPIACGAIGPVPGRAPGLGRIVANSVTIDRLATYMQNPFTGIDRPVRDRTGLKGTWDVTIEWSVGSSDLATTPSIDSGPTFLQALKEQLGLELQPTRGPVNVLVVDHIERPTDN